MSSTNTKHQKGFDWGWKSHNEWEHAFNMFAINLMISCWAFTLDFFLMFKVSLLSIESVSLQVTGTGWVLKGRNILAALSWSASSPLTCTNAHCQHTKTFLRTLRHLLPSAACHEGHTVVTRTARSLSVEALKISSPVPDSHFLVTVSQKGYTATSSHSAQCIHTKEQAEMLCTPFPLCHLLISFSSMRTSILCMKVIAKAASYT